MTLIDQDEYVELSVFDQLVEIISKMTDAEQENLLEALKKRRPQQREERKTMYAETTFTISGEGYNGVVRNLSKSGLFLETQELFSAGQDILVNWRRSQDAKIIKVRGRIARVALNGIGIQFYK